MAQNNGDTAANPFETWIKLRDMTMEGWSKAMIDVVDSDAYAHARQLFDCGYPSAASHAAHHGTHPGSAEYAQ
jgi:hypothetical protein